MKTIMELINSNQDVVLGAVLGVILGAISSSVLFVLKAFFESGKRRKQKQILKNLLSLQINKGATDVGKRILEDIGKISNIKDGTAYEEILNYLYYPSSASKDDIIGKIRFL